MSHFTKNRKTRHNTWPTYTNCGSNPATLSRLSRSHNMNIAHVPRGFFKTSFNLVTSWDSSCTFFRVSSIVLAFVIASPHLVTFSTRDFYTNSTHQLGNLVPFQLQLKHFRFLCQTLGEKKRTELPGIQQVKPWPRTFILSCLKTLFELLNLGWILTKALQDFGMRNVDLSDV